MDKSIKEMLDTHIDITEVQLPRGSMDGQYKFVIDNNIYTAEFIFRRSLVQEIAYELRDPNDDSDFTDMILFFADNKVKKTIPYVDISFYVKYHGEVSYELTGTGNAPLVFSAIKDCFEMYRKKVPDIKIFNFSAKEPSRIKVYKLFSRMMAKSLNYDYTYAEGPFHMNFWVYDPQFIEELKYSQNPS